MTLCWQNIRNLKYLSSIICTPNVIYFVHLTDTYRYDQSHWIIRLHEHVRASQHSSDYSLQLISSKFLLRIQCNTLTPQLRIDSDHFTLVKEKKNDAVPDREMKENRWWRCESYSSMLLAPVDVHMDNLETYKAPTFSEGRKEHEFLPALIKCSIMACPKAVICQR